MHSSRPRSTVDRVPSSPEVWSRRHPSARRRDDPRGHRRQDPRSRRQGGGRRAQDHLSLPITEFHSRLPQEPLQTNPARHLLGAARIVHERRGRCRAGGAGHCPTGAAEWKASDARRRIDGRPTSHPTRAWSARSRSGRNLGCEPGAVKSQIPVGIPLNDAAFRKLQTAGRRGAAGRKPTRHRVRANARCAGTAVSVGPRRDGLGPVDDRATRSR